MQGPSYPGKITLVSTWYEDGIDPNNNSGIQRFSHLVIPTQYQCVDQYHNLDTDWVGSLIPVLILCIDTSPTLVVTECNRQWYYHPTCGPDLL